MGSVVSDYPQNEAVRVEEKTTALKLPYGVVLPGAQTSLETNESCKNEGTKGAEKLHRGHNEKKTGFVRNPGTEITSRARRGEHCVKKYNKKRGGGGREHKERTPASERKTDKKPFVAFLPKDNIETFSQCIPERTTFFSSSTRRQLLVPALGSLSLSLSIVTQRLAKNIAGRVSSFAQLIGDPS